MYTSLADLLQKQTYSAPYGLQLIIPAHLAVPSPSAPAAWADVATALGSMSSNIEQNGWVQSSFWNMHGFCMVGAFIYRNGMNANIMAEAYSALGLSVSEVLLEVLTERESAFILNTVSSNAWYKIMCYNDRFGNTKEEVLSVIARAQEIALSRVPVKGVVPDFIPESMALEPAVA